MQELRSPATGVHSVLTPETVKPEDTQSIESLDSLDSEQPSFRSHVINSNSSNNNNLQSTSEPLSGSDTYRQESPTVIVPVNDVPSSKVSVSHQPPFKQTTKTSTTPTPLVGSFVGFQVVSNNNDGKSMTHDVTRQQSNSNSQTTSVSAPAGDVTKTQAADVNHKDGDQNGEHRFLYFLLCD